MDKALATMLESQRFYGAKSETIEDISVIAERKLPGAGELRWVVVAVEHTGGRETYQLFLDANGADVLHTPAVATALCQQLAAGSAPGNGSVTTVGDAAWTQAEIRSARVISGEQSNTSIIVDDSLMVKFFRKLEPGINPDVELLEGLSTHDCSHIAPLRGYVTHEINGETVVTAMVQDFVSHAVDGWADALACLRTEQDFSDDARSLGVATADVHRLLATAFPTSTVPGAHIADLLNARLDSLTRQVPDLQRYAEPAREVYARLAGHEVDVQRIHGDLHLGQTLKREGSYILIDFEGEPARPLEERRRPDSPLRDVAGLIRSLDYASQFERVHTAAVRDTWATAATSSLLDGYLRDSSTPAELDVLDAYVLDKALYEVAYEVNNRPDWAWIPRNAVERIIGGA